MNKSIIKAKKGDLKCKIDNDKEEGFINPDEVYVGIKTLGVHMDEKDKVIINLQTQIRKQEQVKIYLLELNQKLDDKIEELRTSLDTLKNAFEKTIRGFLER